MPLFLFLADHQVEGTPVFPGAGYVEAAVAAALTVESGQHLPLVLEDLSFRKPLVLGKDGEIQLHIGFDPRERLVSIHGRHRDKEDAWDLHATAKVLERRSVSELPEVLDLEDLRVRCTRAVQFEELYKRLHARGLDYGPMFQAIEGLWPGSG